MSSVWVNFRNWLESSASIGPHPLRGTPLSNFLNWLKSSQGWVFYVLLLGLIVSIVVNFVVFLRQRPETSRTKAGARRGLIWRFLALVGASITLLSVLLPSGAFSGSAFGDLVFFNLLVYVFGLFCLTLFAVPRIITAILGVIWGGLALLVASLAVVTIAEDSARSDIFVIILGSLTLTVGSALVYAEERKRGRERGPVQLAQPTPPSP